MNFKNFLRIALLSVIAGCQAEPPREALVEGKELLTNPNGPDIGVDPNRLQQSIRVIAGATVSQAEVDEGCAAATTGRTLIRFDVKTPNHGPADLVFGHVSCRSTLTSPQCTNVDCSSNPDCCCDGHSTCTASGNPSLGAGFHFSCAHRHIHFESFAEYRLLNAAGEVAATGHKQSFCLMDIEAIGSSGSCAAA